MRKKDLIYRLSQLQLMLNNTVCNKVDIQTWLDDTLYALNQKPAKDEWSEFNKTHYKKLSLFGDVDED